VSLHHLPGFDGLAEQIELCLPVRADLFVLARLTAATVAARGGFTVDEIEDLRLAVDELCLLLGAGQRRGRLHLRYLPDGDVIEVRGIFEPDGRGRAERPAPWAGAGLEDQGELSVRILDALVDEHGQDLAGTERYAWFKKRRVPQLDG
jgi:hypothetical protein